MLMVIIRSRQRHKGGRADGTFLILKFVAGPRNSSWSRGIINGTRTTRPATTLFHAVNPHPTKLFSLAWPLAQIRPADLTVTHSQSFPSAANSGAAASRLRSQRSRAPSEALVVVADTTFCGFGNDTSTASTNCTDNSWRGLRLLHDDASDGSSSGGCWSIPPKPGLRFDLSPRRSGQRRGCWSPNQARHVLAAVQSVQ